MRDLIQRSATAQVLEALRESRAVGLLGPRQVGKSTLARELLRHRWAADYFTLDNQATRVAAAGDPTGFVASMHRPTVIDEVQRVPDLMLAIKERLDLDGSRGQFLLTGSANLMTARTVHDALPGRVDYLFLWGLSQAEVEGRRSRLIDRLFEGRLPRTSGPPGGAGAYADRVVAGGYPDAFRRSSRSRTRFFESYVDSVAGRDLPDVANLRHSDSPARLLRLIASRSSGLLNVASLARDVGLDQKTVAGHLSVLEDLMLVRRSLPWHGNLGSRQIKSPKVYVTDTGLLAALVGADSPRIIRDPIVAGMMFETFVTMELVKLEGTASAPVGIYHYRDSKLREIDIILERPSGEVVAVEVKSGASVGQQDVRALAFLRDRVGGRFRSGVILYTGEKSLPLGDRLAAIPLSSMWTA